MERLEGRGAREAKAVLNNLESCYGEISVSNCWSSVGVRQRKTMGFATVDPWANSTVKPPILSEYA